MKKWKITIPLVVLALAAIAATYSIRPYTEGLTAGTVVTEDIKTVTIIESGLGHYPTSGKAGLVQKGQPVMVGDEGIVGVALNTAAASTDYIAVQLNGIWNLETTNTVAMALGDAVYLNSTTYELQDSATGGILFGYLLHALATTAVGTVEPILLIGATRDFAATATDLSVSSDLYVADDADIEGDLRVDGTLGTSGVATLANLAVTGASAFTGATYNTGTANFDGAVNIDGALATTSTVTAGGAFVASTSGQFLSTGRVFKELWFTSTTLAGTAATTAHITLAGCKPTNSYAWINIANPLLATGLVAEAKVETGIIDVKINQATSATAGLVTVDVLVLRR